MGCVAGIYSSRQLANIPESRTPAESAQISITKSAKMLWKAIPYRNLLFAWAAGFSAFAISIPFSVITIKNGYGISDHYALIFTLILLGGGLFSTLINGTLADRVGPRPLILIYMTGFFFVAGYWCIAPPTFLLIPVGLVFFIAGLCKTGLIVGLSHYFLSIVEERHRVGISLFTRMCGGAAAGLLGSFGGGTVLKVLESSALTGLDMYKTYFRVVLIVLVPLFIIVLQLRRLKEWKVRHILGLLFSIRDMRAMWVMNRIENSQNVNTDVDHLMRLGKIGSRLSESTLRSYLDSPVFSVRIHALQSLRHIDFGEKTVQALIYELQRGQFTSAWVAADILGEHGIKDAVPELRKKLTSSDPFLKGKCMVALTRLQDTASYPDIVKIFINHTNPRVAIHGAHALVEMNEKAHIGLLLEKACMENIQEEVLNEILISLATLCDAGELFYQFLREYERDKKEGIMFIDKILADSKIGTSLVFSEDLYSSSSVPLEKMQHLLSVIPHRDKIPLEHVRRFINTCFYTTIHAKVYFCIVTIVAKP
jgi:MFS family permease